MYICPTCNRGFKNKENIAKHFLQYWKTRNPKHESKPAPCEVITEREVSEDITNFFVSFNQCKK